MWGHGNRRGGRHKDSNNGNSFGYGYECIPYFGTCGKGQGVLKQPGQGSSTQVDMCRRLFVNGTFRTQVVQASLFRALSRNG